MPAPDTRIISKVAQQLRRYPAALGVDSRPSILASAAAFYAVQGDFEELTQPTGFDPGAARLFEAIVECAYLVATADGDFDAVERDAFQRVVSSACGGTVLEPQLSALLGELAALLQRDGRDQRMLAVARAIHRPEQAREILRIAAFLAAVSGGVNRAERDTLERLSAALGLEGQVIAQALSEVSSVLTA